MLLKRTHTCGELRLEDQTHEVVLNGWIEGHRDLGGLVFADVRDRYGVTQIVIDESDDAVSDDMMQQAAKLRAEDVIGCRGFVRERESKNPEMPTGGIEIVVTELVVYSKSDVPPFEVKTDVQASDDLRLRYRYLDLRRHPLQQKLQLRSKVAHAIRDFYHKHEFAEIETPVLMKSTPEGARDYLVPSRVNAGSFYALPQSPQTYKQMLMVSGFDRYVQIVKCFRDEDLRADRQPEFTQVDVEMSFVDEEDVYVLHEGLMGHLWSTFMDVELPKTFHRMTYDEAIRSYGSDKPDLRFGSPIIDLSDALSSTGFKLFDDAVAAGGHVLGIRIPGQGSIGRGALDRFIDKVKHATGVPGVIYAKWTEEGLTSSVAKFLTEDHHQAIMEGAKAEEGDLVLILAGEGTQLFSNMGTMRLLSADEWSLRETHPSSFGPWAFCWVTDFPLVEWDEDEQRYFALHHPFTSPHLEDTPQLQSNPASVRSRAYDLVLNGSEIGGGSIRIHQQEMQRQVFDLLGIGDKEADEKFGFLLKAFSYGAPPHGGIALGLDRILMIMTGAESIRDVIAFPKNQRAQSLMDASPSPVATEQLDELHIRLAEGVKPHGADEEL
ncbi:MAG: aspartate--tRNA ligase [Balneolaceae bacterium]|nr:aspartate--tRNA ligase [Balneolaceae bacterium]